MIFIVDNNYNLMLCQKKFLFFSFFIQNAVILVWMINKHHMHTYL